MICIAPPAVDASSFLARPLVLGGPGGRMRCVAGDGFLVAARALRLGSPSHVAGLVPARRQLAHLHGAVLCVDAAATTRVPAYDVGTRIAPVAVVHGQGALDYAHSGPVRATRGIAAPAAGRPATARTRTEVAFVAELDAISRSYLCRDGEAPRT